MAPQLPSDHPEFFRRPPPKGRSRESDIVVDELGRFWHAGQRVSHPRMARAFASWLGRHPDNGRYVLNNGYDWSYLRVMDAPLAVTAVGERSGNLAIELSDGTREPLVEPIWEGKNGAVYTQVRHGWLTARFQPAAQAELGRWLTERDGSFWLECGAERLRIAEYPSS